MCSSTKIRIGFGVGFCILVGIYLFYVEGNRIPTIKTREIAMDQIHKVEFLSPGSNSSVLLFRDGENWFVGARAYRADKRNVSSTVNYFSRKFSLELVSRDLGYYLSAGVDSNSIRVVRMYGKPTSVGGENILLKEVKVGKVHPSSADYVYVLGEDGYVYKVSSYGFSTEASRDLTYFRTKKIFPTELADSVQKTIDKLESVDFFGVSFAKKDVLEDQQKVLEKILVDDTKDSNVKTESVKFLWKSDTGVTLHPYKCDKFLQGLFGHNITAQSYLADGLFREGDLKKYLFFEFSCRSTEGQQWNVSIYKHPEKTERDKGKYILSSSELKSLVLLTSEDDLIKSIPVDWKRDWNISI